MTKKRFHHKEDDWEILDGEKHLAYAHSGFQAEKICGLLNELNEENERLKFENETLKSNYQREIQSSIDFCNTYSKTNGKLLEEIDQLKQKIEQLQERNNRQAKQLDDLYRLIEEKDWRALSDIMDDFKKSDELLQKEWGLFG